MTTYNRSERQRLHYRLRRWQRLINYLLAVLVVAVLLAAPGSASVASAAPRCPGNGQCVGQPGGMVCAWPFVLVRVGTVAVCSRMAVQP